MKLIKSILLICSVFLFTEAYSITHLSNSKKSSIVSAKVTASKSNILYVGINNPIEIYVPGIPDDKISVTISNGNIRKSHRNFIARIRRPGKSIITVFENINGVNKKIASKVFRGKRVPDPVAKIFGKTGGKISKNYLRSQSGVLVQLEDFNYDVKFRVTGFAVSACIRGFFHEVRSKGNQFTSKQRQLMSSLKKGDKVFIDNIRAKGPDGSIRKLPPIIFTID